MQIIVKDEIFKNGFDHRDQWSWSEVGWGNKWVTDPGWNNEQTWYCAFRLIFKLKSNTKLRFHTSADQRYRLYLDGEQITFGPDRGDDANWFYQTFDEKLSAGKHTIVTFVSFAMGVGYEHNGHIGNSPAFMLHAESGMDELLDTGKANWEVLTITDIKPNPAFALGYYHCVGARTAFHASEQTKNFASGSNKAGEWKPVKIQRNVENASLHPSEFCPQRLVKPSTIPPMLREARKVGKVIHAEYLEQDTMKDGIDAYFFDAASSNSNLAAAADELLKGEKKLTIPANTKLRLLVDLKDYYCAFVSLNTSNGAESKISVYWSEGLYLKAESIWDQAKGNRNEYDGKQFRGLGDWFYPDGAKNTPMETVWWEAGRYIRIYVETGAAPLTINDFTLIETHYPTSFKATLKCSDNNWKYVEKISKRALNMCSHEVYFDCPYYEQLMYAGDTRLEILTTYALSNDSRLPEKAIALFEASRQFDNITQARVPSRMVQHIPGFCLWWIMMVHDHFMWKDNLDFVKKMMPGVRQVINTFIDNIDPEVGLWRAIRGWNFMDWSEKWVNGGIVPGGNIGGITATQNIQLIYVLKCTAELEDAFGEKYFAMRLRNHAEQLSAAVVKNFWREDKAMFVENLDREIYTMHAQSLAILADIVPVGAKIVEAMNNEPNIHKTTIYFSHYYFEALRKAKRMDYFFKAMPLWFNLKKLGLCTTVEQPEPSRSDCHAWGAHPLFHFHASVCGVRPAAPGFKAIEITPQLEELEFVETSMPHPQGEIKVNLKNNSGKYTGTIITPEGVPSKVNLPDGRTFEWVGGVYNIK
jgi:hypothetical protein